MLKNKKMLIPILVVVGLVVGAGLYMTVLKGPAGPQPPVAVSLGEITTNLADPGDGIDHYVKVTIVLKVRATTKLGAVDAATGTATLEDQTGALDAVNSAFGRMTPDDVAADGHEIAKQKIKRAITAETKAKVVSVEFPAILIH